MKKFLLIGAALLGCAATVPAQAADLPLKAPPLVVVWDWTGFYVGGNVGYSWGKWDNSGLASTGSPNVDGWLAGLQAGYNWQINPTWVVGLEGDIQITGEKASEDPGVSTTTDIQGIGNLAPFHTITTTSAANEWKFPWFATFRGRAGFLIDPTTLIYGTGGLALGHFKMSSTATTTSQTFRGTVGTTTNPLGPAVTTVGTGLSDSVTRAGWTLGLGGEKKLTQAWSVKVEYLYLDFGTRTFFAGTASATSVRLRDNILRIGLNYKLN